MIEINLVPDVKQELINAQSQRRMVISGAILATLAAVGLVVLLAVWVFGYQTLRHVTLDRNITSKHAQLSAVEDLPNALTIQNQLMILPQLHQSNSVNSRMLDVLATITPTGENQVAVSKFTLDTEQNLITIEAQADSGYQALEVFRKTILATSINYQEEGERRSELLTSAIIDGERSYGEDSEGRRVLRFTISFEYPENLLSTSIANVTIAAPDRTNVTDSRVGVPSSLFTERAQDEEED